MPSAICGFTVIFDWRVFLNLENYKSECLILYILCGEKCKGKRQIHCELGSLGSPENGSYIFYVDKQLSSNVAYMLHKHSKLGSNIVSILIFIPY